MTRSYTVTFLFWEILMKMSHETQLFFPPSRSFEDIRTPAYSLKHFKNFIRSHVLRYVRVKSVTFFIALLCKIGRGYWPTFLCREWRFWEKKYWYIRRVIYKKVIPLINTANSTIVYKNVIPLINTANNTIVFRLRNPPY